MLPKCADYFQIDVLCPGHTNNVVQTSYHDSTPKPRVMERVAEWLRRWTQDLESKDRFQERRLRLKVLGLEPKPPLFTQH